MPSNPNKLSQFWQELKRRNVTRVLAVYIAVAFMVLELVDILSEPYRLPDWTLRVTFLILVVVFFITIIISWIYDITPKGVAKLNLQRNLTVQGLGGTDINNHEEFKYKDKSWSYSFQPVKETVA